MPIIVDEATFSHLSEDKAAGMVAAVARILHASPLVEFDLDTVTAPHRDSLFELCFFAIAVFEEQNGFEVGGRRYVPRIVFETGRSGSDPILLIADMQVHGFLQDPALDAGLSRARHSIHRQE